jgi:vanillate O-demethylase ferredoxin subunit
MHNWIDVKITRRESATDAISIFELRRPDGEPLPPFTAGAHIDVKVNDEIIRQYSLCNDPAENHRYVIAVLNEAESRGGSRAIHANFQVDSVASISEPRNHFALVDSEDHTVLVAGGIGVTPILAMARTLLRAGRSFELHYCVRSRNSAAFLDVLAAPELAERVVLHIDDEPGTTKLVLDEILKRKGTQLYVCGPAGFMSWVVSSAAAYLPAEAIHQESFTAAPMKEISDEGFEVEVASSGQVLFVPKDRSVAEVLAEAGIEVLVSCEQGICGSCVTNILWGVPDHRDSVLSQGDKNSGKVFTPCCSRAKSSRLVLDI